MKKKTLLALVLGAAAALVRRGRARKAEQQLWNEAGQTPDLR